MPGPKPKPTALKVLQGNPGHQKLRRNEPKPRPVTPDPPEYLNDDGKFKWFSLLPELEYIGTLTFVDADVLGRYCHGYQRLVEAERELATSERIKTRGTGGEVLNPWVTERNRAWDDMQKAWPELGIGAASRSRIEVKKQDEQPDDPTAKAIGIAAVRK